MKRLIDVVAALVGLVILGLPMLILGLIICWDSPGPALYRARRLGRGGKIFTMYKFRTMVSDAARYGAVITAHGDSRITRVGRWLRAGRIDEWPQLLNVLCGDMSLVGPRPETPECLPYYDQRQREILQLTPGITGLTQICYRNEEAILGADNTFERYVQLLLPRKLELDRVYMQQQSLYLDIAIIWATLNSRAKGLYQQIADAYPDLVMVPELSAQGEDVSMTTTRKFMPIAGHVVLDILFVLLAYATAFQLRIQDWQPSDEHRIAIAGMALLYVLCGAFFGIYQRLWARASLYEVFVIIKTVGMSTVVILLANVFWPGSTARLSTLAILIGGMFAMVGFVATRYHWRLFKQIVIRLQANRQAVQRVLIVGAGEAGQLVARMIRESSSPHTYQLLGYLDDDPVKIGRVVMGIKVLGRCDEVAYWTGRVQADMLIIAMRNIERVRLRQIIAACQATPARVQISPGVLDFTEPLSIRDVTLDDLIGRPPVAINAEECRSLFSGKRILVTGAGGSIGSELVRQLSKFAPANLLLLDSNETSLYDLSNELRWLAPEQQQTIILCDVTNQQRVNDCFVRHQPELVFHVAAYKHVPMLEEYVNPAIITNLWGTMVVSQAALQHGAERFTFVSTDKAVHPSSVMGTTKRLGELWVASLNAHPSQKTIFTAVRFGNVIGSRGSVVPLFWQQIERGGPVTVTHREMTRFFMSIPEAASLIAQATVYASGQDIFMLDMGDEIKIVDLATRMIRLRGLRVGEDIQIVYTGVRPGEKLHEELALEKEMRSETPHPRIYRLCQNPTLSDTDTLRALYNELLHVHAHTDDSIMRKLLRLYLQAAEAGHRSLSAVNTPALNESTRMLITQWVESHMLYRRQD